MPPQSPTQLDFSMLTAEWPDIALALLATLETPWDIQVLIDQLPYSADAQVRSPLSVLRDHRAHCLDGALLAACALRRLRERPLVLDLRAEGDEDHVVALFTRDGRWGCVSKSTRLGAGFRPPMYRTVAELARTFAPMWLDAAGATTLRGISRPLDLRRLDHLGWMSEDAGLDALIAHIDAAPHGPL